MCVGGGVVDAPVAVTPTRFLKWHDQSGIFAQACRCAPFVERTFLDSCDESIHRKEKLAAHNQSPVSCSRKGTCRGRFAFFKQRRRQLAFSFRMPVFPQKDETHVSTGRGDFGKGEAKLYNIVKASRPCPTLRVANFLANRL